MNIICPICKKIMDLEYIYMNGLDSLLKEYKLCDKHDKELDDKWKFRKDRGYQY